MTVALMRKLKNRMSDGTEGLQLLVMLTSCHWTNSPTGNNCKLWTNYKLQPPGGTGEQPEAERDLRHKCIWKKGMALGEFLIFLMAFCLRAATVCDLMDEHRTWRDHSSLQLRWETPEKRQMQRGSPNPAHTLLNIWSPLNYTRHVWGRCQVA